MSHILLAKSPQFGGLTLKEHTDHVLSATEIFASKLGFDVSIARLGAILHDIGKAHPHFQAKLHSSQRVWESDKERRDWQMMKHRHELSSLLFLPAFPKEIWPELIEMVVAHHKSIERDRSERGLLDLLDNAIYQEDVLDDHIKAWSEWSPKALALLSEYGIHANITQTEAENAWEYAVSYCQKKVKLKDWSTWRGLLMAADHFASALSHETQKRATKTFQVPDIQLFEPDKPGGILYPLTDLPVNDPRKHTLVVAPTGAGKTNYLVRRCKGQRIFYTLPFQASINAMYDRMKALLPDADIRMLHSAVRMALKQYQKEDDEGDDFEEEYSLQSLVGSSIKVLTPHQLASIIFGTKGFEAVMLDLRGAAIIMDEIHTYSDVSRAIVIELVRVLIRFGCSIHIGTATMPSLMYDELLALLGGNVQTYEVALPDDALMSYNRHIICKTESWYTLTSIMDAAMMAHEKVLIVCNTIKKAQEIYEQLLESYSQYAHMMIHSRFRRCDRSEKEISLRNDFEGDKALQNGHRPCWVVATQVVEVSLDISFDRLITAAAPIDALIQRFGRINRRRTIEALGQYKPVHVVAPTGNQLPYNGDIVRRSYEALPDGEVLDERHLQQLIDIAYPELPPMKEIDIHLAWHGENFKLGCLTNSKKSLLMEVLQIDSATCILATDRDTYLTQPDKRDMLEIPIPWSGIRFYAKLYEQLECGRNPYVVPQSLEQHQEFGLKLGGIDNIL